MRVISGSARGTALYGVEEETTRPTLDRVKESLFNIINNKIDDETIGLDLFSGSGAIGIELLSRGARKVYFCDLSKKAINTINNNLEKTRLKAKAEVINKDYRNALSDFKKQNIQFDIIYIDPPYKDNISKCSIEIISKDNLLKDNGIIIVETDENERDKREIDSIENLKYEIYDSRKYGRAHLIFLK